MTSHTAQGVKDHNPQAEMLLSKIKSASLTLQTTTLPSPDEQSPNSRLCQSSLHDPTSGLIMVRIIWKQHF